MSEAARRDLARKRHWAEPGSRHDRLVRTTKFVLPILIVALVLMLALAPFDERGDVSFIFDKNKVDSAPERMRVEAARHGAVGKHHGAAWTWTEPLLDGLPTTVAEAAGAAAG